MEANPISAVVTTAEEILAGAVRQYQEQISGIAHEFSITREQAARVAKAYAAEVERKATLVGWHPTKYEMLMPMSKRWALLGFYAGQIVAYEEDND